MSTAAPESFKVETFIRNVARLYGQQGDGRESLLTMLLHKEDAGPSNASTQDVALGRRPHPYNFEAVTNFKNSNEHHSACLAAKVAATVGLGHVSAEELAWKASVAKAKMNGEAPPIKPFIMTKADKVLSPLCQNSWQDVISDACEDYQQVGSGYIEVVRKDKSKPDAITGLHHIPATDVYVYVEDALYNRHFEVKPPKDGSGQSRHYARFGDKLRFLSAAKEGKSGFTLGAVDPINVSEVIHFRKPTSLDRWYGFSDWISCVAAIELNQCLTQYKYDFFLNRGVPEFMLFFLGQQIDDPKWKTIKEAIQANIGMANSHKSMAVNLTDPAMKVQLEKLAMEQQSAEPFGDMGDALAMKIVTAHRVPPLLAGIQIPGKLGANNELANALSAFQCLCVAPDQRVFEQTFAMTIANSVLNGGLGIEPQDMVLKTILEEIDLTTADTMGRMKQPVQQAQADGRNLQDGVKK